MTEQRGLVCRQGQLKGLLLPGKHMVSPFDKVEVQAVDQPFQAQEAALEIALHWIDGNLNGVLTPGRTAFWKGLRQRRFHLVDLDQTEATDQVNRPVLLHPAVRD